MIAYEPVIGLEVHCRLHTASKLFSPDASAYGAAPNTHVDPVSLGHPGTLPVLNAEAVAQARRLALAVHATLARRAHFARKHYVYPDLPKGYQITQHGTPLAFDGYLDLPPDPDAAAGDGRAGSGGAGDGLAGDGTARIGLTRLHLEEDAGKSMHDAAAGRTRIDYNRCGTPLVELVTAPDLRTPRQAYRFLKKLRQLVRYLGVSDGNMEEGSLRCDANVSVRPRGQHGYGVRVEVKNLNSMRHVEQALEYEITRQTARLERGAAVAPETRRWDADRLETVLLRTKEEQADYRYLPEPDLGPVTTTDEAVAALRAGLPEMPDARRRRFERDVGLPPYDAAVLTDERAVADYFEDALAALFKRTKGGNTAAQAKALANVVMTDVLRVLGDDAHPTSAPAGLPVTPERLAQLVFLRHQDRISASTLTPLFDLMMREPDASAGKLADEHDLLQVSDPARLAPVVEAVLDDHPGEVHRYRSGKKSLMGFFMGKVMKRFDGAPDPTVARRLLEDRLR